VPEVIENLGCQNPVYTAGNRKPDENRSQSAIDGRESGRHDNPGRKGEGEAAKQGFDRPRIDYMSLVVDCQFWTCGFEKRRPDCVCIDLADNQALSAVMGECMHKDRSITIGRKGQESKFQIRFKHR
jgi:hypothetical protein